MTTPTTHRSIAERLGIPYADLSALDTCTDEELARLDATLAKTIAAEDRAVDDGFAEALRFVPRPLRGRAKVLLFGGDHD